MTLKQSKAGYSITMTEAEMAALAEVIWLLRHSPPPIGFTRKPLTFAQNQIVQAVYDLIEYDDNYWDFMQKRNGQ